MGVGIALASILALGGAGIYLGLKTIENYNPGRGKIQKDLQELRSLLSPVLCELVPWSREEMEQLSFNLTNRKTSKRVVKTTSGVFTTIYHEPMIAWAYRRYVSSQENAVVLAVTSHHEFVYRIAKSKTEVVVDQVLLGEMDAVGVLTGIKGKQVLGAIDIREGELYHPVTVLGRNVGSLTNEQKSTQLNARAFQLLSPMSKEEEKVFLALAIGEMVSAKA